MNVLLNERNSYKWNTFKDVSCRGIMWLKDSEQALSVESIVNLFSACEDFDSFIETLQSIDGVFSIIIKKKNVIWFAVDIARSMPLYYDTNGSCISDSAESVRQFIGLDKENVSEFNYKTLLSCDYIFGNDTVYDEIKQLDLGEAAEITDDGRVKQKKYFYHLSEVIERSENEIKKELTGRSRIVFRRLKNIVGDRPVLLSMSGGYDSRFVGCMLKETGFQNVSCYTYGKADSFEVAQSKQNAEALGFRWNFVEYTDEEMKRGLDDIGKDYINSYEGHDFTAYFQNFPAVRKLHEIGWIEPNSVVFTGLCGDMPTGGYIEHQQNDIDYNINTAVEKLYEMIFSRFEMDSVYKNEWFKKMKAELEGLPIDIKDYQTWVSAIDCIYTGTCHVHWFMHMNSVHSYFGYQWLLPFWDSSFLKLWYSIPAKLRYKRNLYERWLLNDVCSKYGIGQKKYVATYSENKFKRCLIYHIGTLLSYVSLNLGVPFKRKYDFNNFAPLELLLFQNLKTRDTVFYSKAGFQHLLNQYILQSKYDVDNMKRYIKGLKVRYE